MQTLNVELLVLHHLIVIAMNAAMDLLRSVMNSISLLLHQSVLIFRDATLSVSVPRLLAISNQSIKAHAYTELNMQRKHKARQDSVRAQLTFASLSTQMEIASLKWANLLPPIQAESSLKRT